MSEGETKVSLSKDELCALPLDERVAIVEAIRVQYPQWTEVLERIRLCHDMRSKFGAPKCLLIVGPSGAGKSTLLASYADSYPPARVPTAWGTTLHRPVAMASIPARATVKTMATKILYALGDPRAGTGTEGDMTLRIMRRMDDCGVQMLLLDEVQHLSDRDSDRILENASDWLKTLIKDTNVSCVMAGMDGPAQEVVDINPQLKRLFGNRRNLRPFEWDTERPDTVKEFRLFLRKLESLLPLREASNLFDKDRALRCFVACGGILGYLMYLVREAAEQALWQHRECIDDTLLAEAYDEQLAYIMELPSNPFEGPPPEPPTTKVKTQKTQRIKRPTGATNNHSRARKPRGERLSDVLG